MARFILWNLPNNILLTKYTPVLPGGASDLSVSWVFIENGAGLQRYGIEPVNSLAVF
jgi:hypothetical protein